MNPGRWLLLGAAMLPAAVLADPVSAFIAVAFATGNFLYAVAAAIAVSFIQQQIRKKKRGGREMDPAQTKTYVQQPFAPRQVCYGEAWLAPKIVYSGNSRKVSNSYNGTYGDGKPRGYVLVNAIADHDVEILDVRINGDDFFTQEELKKFNGIPFVIGVNQANDNHFEPTKRNPEGDVPYERERADRVADISGDDVDESSLNHLMLVIPKPMAAASTSTLLQNYADPSNASPTPTVGASDEEIRLYLKSQLDSGRITQQEYELSLKWYGESSGDIPRSGFGAVLFALNKQLRLNEIGNQDARWRYFTPPKNFATWEATDMHMHGTATLTTFLPIVESKLKEPIWPRPPDLMLRVRRPKHTLLRWTDEEVYRTLHPMWAAEDHSPTYAEYLDTVPAYDEDWRLDNAALCAYDYLARYTDYRNPVGGYWRIDLDTVAQAAKICHDKNYKANGAITLADSPYLVLDQFTLAMGGGKFVEAAGVIKMYAGEAGRPVANITETDLVADSWGITTTPDRSSRRGLTDMTYVDDTGEQQSIAFHHSSAKANLKISQQDLIFINNADQARHVAFILNSRAWDTSTVTFTLAPGSETPFIHDVVTLSIDSLGIKGDFRIAAAEEAEDGQIRVQAHTERKDLYEAGKQVKDYIPPPTPLIGSGGATADGIIVSSAGESVDLLGAGTEYATAAEAPPDYGSYSQWVSTSGDWWVEVTEAGRTRRKPIIAPSPDVANVAAASDIPIAPTTGSFILVTAAFTDSGVSFAADTIYRRTSTSWVKYADVVSTAAEIAALTPTTGDLIYVDTTVSGPPAYNADTIHRYDGSAWSELYTHKTVYYSRADTIRIN